MDWKYIMYHKNEDHRVPIIFPNFLAHVDVARRVNGLVSEGGRYYTPIISAGFLSGLGVTGVHGLSETLGDLKSNPTDAAIINLMQYEAGRESTLPGVEKMVLIAVIKNLMDRVEQL